METLSRSHFRKWLRGLFYITHDVQVLPRTHLSLGALVPPDPRSDLVYPGILSSLAPPSPPSGVRGRGSKALL